MPTPGLACRHNDGFEERVQFVSANYSATEEEGTALISVRRIGLSQKRVRVGCKSVPGPGAPGQDYHPASGRLMIVPGETVKTFAAVLRRDRKEEVAETILPQWRSVSPRRVQIGTPATAVLAISD